MGETLSKADLQNLRTDLQEDIRGTEQRLDAKIDGVSEHLSARIDGVSERLGARIDGVDQRLDTKMDTGFALVGRLIAETEDRLLRHTDMRFESVQENIRKLADGVLASNEQLARHIQQSDAEHRRLESMILAGDAVLDIRVTALESRS